MNKLSNLRQLSPKQALQAKIFSENKIRSPIVNAIPVNRLITKIHDKRTQPQQVHTPPIKRMFNRKQSENKDFQNEEDETETLSSRTKSQSFTDIAQHSKSMKSTKANSQKLSISNSSIEGCFDEKDIIIQSHQKVEKFTIPVFNNLINTINQNHVNQIQINCEQQIKSKQLGIYDFDVLSLCGQGSFGAVYIVRHKMTGAIYALKKIMKQNIITDIDKQCLINEIQINLKLNHPNIIKFYSTFSTSQAIYILMELCHCGSIYQKLKKQGAFSQDQVRSVIRQVCTAINYLHSLNLIHRDIKAENIVLHDNVVKLCDFGWAIESELCRNSLFGTPIYISPEVVKHQPYDKKVDVWSIGVLTYELIYGKIPFDIKSQDDLHKIVDEEIQFSEQKEVSSVCKDFIQKCLQKDSYKRWDTTKLLNHAFLKRQ